MQLHPPQSTGLLPGCRAVCTSYSPRPPHPARQDRKGIKGRNDSGAPLCNDVSKFRARNLACPASAKPRNISQVECPVSGKKVRLEPLPSFCVVTSAFRCTVFREVPSIGLGNGSVAR